MYAHLAAHPLKHPFRHCVAALLEVEGRLPLGGRCWQAAGPGTIQLAPTCSTVQLGGCWSALFTPKHPLSDTPFLVDHNSRGPFAPTPHKKVDALGMPFLAMVGDHDGIFLKVVRISAMYWLDSWLEELTERDQDGFLRAEEVDWMLGMPRRGVLRPSLPSCCCCCCCRPSINALLYTLYVVVAFVPTLPAHRTIIRAGPGDAKRDYPARRMRL